MADLFAPPSEQELTSVGAVPHAQAPQQDMFAPPTQAELQTGPTGPKADDLFAPPTNQELAKTAPDAPLSMEDFQRIGQKYGVDPTELRNLAPYYQIKMNLEPNESKFPGSIVPAVEQGLKETAGTAGASLGLNIPQFIYKKLQNIPMQYALDELQDIASNQHNIIEKAAQLTVAPVAGLPAKTALGRIAGNAAIGATAGAAGSSEGNELQGAESGAVLGGGLGVAGEGLGALAKKLGTNGVENELAARRQVDIGKGQQEVAQRTADSEKILEDIGFGQKTALTNEDIDKLVNQQLGEENLSKMLDPSTDEGQLMRSKVEKSRPMEVKTIGYENAIKRDLADDIVDSRITDFAEDLTGKKQKQLPDAINDVEEFAKRQGTEATLNRYRDFLGTQQASKYLEESGAKMYNQPNFIGKAANFISDNQYVLRHIDDKLGTNSEGIVSQLNKDYSRSTYALDNFRKQQEQLFQGARKLGTDAEITSNPRLYNALDTGNIASLTPNEQETVSKFKQYFDGVLGFSNKLVQEKDPRISPLSIPIQENYVPHMLKTSPEMLSMIEKKLTAVEPQLQQMGNKLNLANQDIQDLVNTVKMFNNNEVKTPQELITRVKDLIYSRDGKVALETAARAAQERTGEIPDYLLEKNLYKLADKYTANTLRHLYLRNGIDKLRYEAQKMEKAGADIDATYVQNLIRDIMGVRKGTAAEAFLQTKIAGMRKLDQMIDQVGKDSVRGGILTAAKAIPDMMYALTRQIYPNVLGYFNLRAVLQNATAGFTKLAPELGSRYGYTTTLRSGMYTIANFGRLIQKARQLGNFPAEFTRKGEQAVAEGIRRSALYHIPAAALEGMGKAGMALYQKSEEFNRALVLSVGEVMAQDLAKGSPAALGALKRFPEPVRNFALSNRNNPTAVAEVIGKHLNDTTQYNYNRISLAEFGRTLGPLFSAFSKWPTATAGDMIYNFRNRGILGGTTRNVEKYVVPLVLLQALDYIAGERMGDKDSLSDTQKHIMGSHGLSQSAPIGSASGFLNGQVFTPPAIDALTQALIVPVMKGNTGSLEQGGASILKNFAPGAGLFRFITDDLVTYASGSTPEGSDFIEKTGEGIKKLGRMVK